MLYFFKNCNETVIFETATYFLISSVTDHMSTRPAKNQQVLYSKVYISYVYIYKKLYSRYIINRNFPVNS